MKEKSRREKFGKAIAKSVYLPLSREALYLQNCEAAASFCEDCQKAIADFQHPEIGDDWIDEGAVVSAITGKELCADCKMQELYNFRDYFDDIEQLKALDDWKRKRDAKCCNS